MANSPTEPIRDLPAGPVPRRSNPVLVVFLLLLIGGIGVLIWFETRPQPRDNPVDEPRRAFYTVDDGKSWFADDAEKLPPFEHDGKPAVRVHLFRCDGGTTPFVGYLRQLPDEAIRFAATIHGTPDDDELAIRYGWLVKRPGVDRWLSSLQDPEGYQTMIHVKCPDGKQATPVLPGKDEH